MKKITFYLSIFVFIIPITFHSCKKQLKPEVSELEFTDYKTRDKFYTFSDTTDPVVKKIINKLKTKDGNGKIATRVSKNSGLPYWEKAVLFAKASKKASKGTSVVVDTNYVFVPLVPEGSKEVEGAIACKVVGDSVTANFLHENDYRSYGFLSSDQTNASSLINLMMYLQNKTFGTGSFVIYDNRLLLSNSDSINKSGTKLVTFKPVTVQSAERISGSLNARYETVEICIIYGHYGCPTPSHQGQLCTDNSQYYTTQRCFNFLAWVDDSSPRTDNGGSGGGSTGGGSTGGSGGGSGTGGSYTGSTSTVQYLNQQFENLTPAEVSFLDSYEFASEEIYNYLTSTDGILTTTEMKRLGRSHFNYMMLDNSPLWRRRLACAIIL
jgi:uncharacterized membrane protein YgcG